MRIGAKSRGIHSAGRGGRGVRLRATLFPRADNNRRPGPLNEARRDVIQLRTARAAGHSEAGHVPRASIYRINTSGPDLRPFRPVSAIVTAATHIECVAAVMFLSCRPLTCRGPGKQFRPSKIRPLRSPGGWDALFRRAQSIR